jgi:PAS domain S-box-containing protein
VSDDLPTPEPLAKRSSPRTFTTHHTGRLDALVRDKADPTRDLYATRTDIFFICAVAFLVVNTTFCAINFALGLPLGAWLFNAAATPFVLALVLTVRRRGYSRPLAFVSISALGLVIIASAFTSGGLISGDAYWVLFLPLAAALLSVGRQSAAWGILSMLSVLGMWMAHTNGLLLGSDTPMPDALVTRHALNALGVIAAASSITWAFATLYDRSLARAHDALARAESDREELDRVARALDDALGRLRALTDHTDALIFSFDADLELVGFNAPADAFFTGLGRGPLTTGTPVLDLHVRNRALARDFYDRALAGEAYTSDFVVGTGANEIIFELTLSPVSTDGAVSMVTVLARDITAQRKLERERELLHAQAADYERLERLGVMAGAFAHDFNNLLTGILGEIELATESLEDDDADEALESLVAARAATVRASDTTRTLLTYAGRRPKRTELLDARDCARDARTLARSATGRAIEIELFVEDEPAHIHGDVGQLEQLLLNLLINAVQATLEHHDSDHPPVRLRVHTLDLDDLGGSVTPWIERQRGEHVVVEVTDSGPGLTREAIGRVFEPFYSTKDSGQGLGLAAASGIARSHGGHLGVESQPGAGATFRLVLPLAKDARSTVPVSASKDSLDAGGLVLVVDDNDDVRSALKRMLERVGFEVVDADNGRDALDAWDREPPRVSIVDMLMPGMDGAQVLAAIKERDPLAPVLLVSGYTDQDVEHLQLSYPPHTVLFCPKPISLEQLFGALDHLLDAPSDT